LLLTAVLLWICIEKRPRLLRAVKQSVDTACPRGFQQQTRARLGGGAMRQIDSPIDPALRPMRAVSKGENMTIKNVSVKMWPVGSHG